MSGLGGVLILVDDVPGLDSRLNAARMAFSAIAIRFFFSDSDIFLLLDFDGLVFFCIVPSF